MDVCLEINGMQKIRMPYKDKGNEPNVKFVNYKQKQKQLKVPFIIYADFECIWKPTDEKYGDNTKTYQEHEPCG